MAIVYARKTLANTARRVRCMRCFGPVKLGVVPVELAVMYMSAAEKCLLRTLNSFVFLLCIQYSKVQHISYLCSNSTP